MFFELIASAYFGGIAINIVRLCELQSSSKKDRKILRDWIYWVQFFVLPLLGSGLVYLYVSSGVTLSPILSAQIGASAPLIIKSFTSAVSHATTKTNTGPLENNADAS